MDKNIFLCFWKFQCSSNKNKKQGKLQRLCKFMGTKICTTKDNCVTESTKEGTPKT